MTTCISFAIFHAVIMTLFALGLGWIPFIVYLIDYPVAHFTIKTDSLIIGLGIPIVICSILYPTIVFLAGLPMLRIFRKKPVALGAFFELSG